MKVGIWDKGKRQRWLSKDEICQLKFQAESKTNVNSLSQSLQDQ